MKKTLEERIEEAVREEVVIAPPSLEWPVWFEKERDYLRRLLPAAVIARIEHFGSTAVPGLAAKPIIDILVGVSSLTEARAEVAPLLEAAGYDYFWRTDCEPPYAWFIKRDDEGRRTHHLHMVEADSKLWERLYFRDYLREFTAVAREYEGLKRALSETYPSDRIAYTKGKTEFVLTVTEEAKRHYGASALPTRAEG